MSHHMERTHLPDPKTPEQAAKNYDAIMGSCNGQGSIFWPCIFALGALGLLFLAAAFH